MKISHEAIKYHSKGSGVEGGGGRGNHTEKSCCRPMKKSHLLNLLALVFIITFSRVQGSGFLGVIITRHFDLAALIHPPQMI